MTRVIRFLTAKFDVSAERLNPINPIPGESLLLWLREQARPHFELSHPEPEDWGWYSFVTLEGPPVLARLELPLRAVIGNGSFRSTSRGPSGRSCSDARR